jgi:hypothetical protein
MPIPISPEKVTVVPATQEKVYDVWWLSQFVIDAADANLPVKAIVTMNKAHRDVMPATETEPEKVIYEYSPEPPLHFVINDVFAEAATSPEIAATVVAILTNIQIYGTKKGLL